MSIKLMTAVWDRYPGTGNEMLLALMLADHAHDDGTHIWPSNKLMAEKTRTSQATVKRLRATMIARGWLILMRRASGRRGDTNVYSISPSWIAGGVLEEPGLILSPLEDDEGPVDKSGGEVETRAQSEQNQGSNSTKPGLTAVTPESPGTTKEPNTPPPPVGDNSTCGKVGQHRSPNSRTSVDQKGQDERPPWRWTGKRKDVEAQAKKHGMPEWDETAYSQGKGEAFHVYRSRVQAKVQGL